MERNLNFIFLPTDSRLSICGAPACKVLSWTERKWRFFISVHECCIMKVVNHRRTEYQTTGVTFETNSNGFLCCCFVISFAVSRTERQNHYSGHTYKHLPTKIVPRECTQYKSFIYNHSWSTEKLDSPYVVPQECAHSSMALIIYAWSSWTGFFSRFRKGLPPCTECTSFKRIYCIRERHWFANGSWASLEFYSQV